MTWPEDISCLGKGVMYHVRHHDKPRKRFSNGDNSPYLRHYRNDFSQNTELSGRDLSDYSRDMDYNSGCSFVRNVYLHPLHSKLRSFVLFDALLD